MFSEKQTNNFLTLIFLIPVLGVFIVIVNIFLIKKCERTGYIFGLETRERFFAGCQYKTEKNEWKNIKNFWENSFKREYLSTGFPQVEDVDLDFDFQFLYDRERRIIVYRER